MTAFELSLYVALAIFLQGAAFAALAFYRHWLTYQDLKKRLADLTVSSSDQPSRSQMQLTDTTKGVAAWKGFRKFRVIRKTFEDIDKSVCSFYLSPVDGEGLPNFKPGQFLAFKLDIPDLSTGDAKSVVRCYSLSDGPGLDYYRVSIKRVPAPDATLPPGLSSGHFHDAVQEGTVLAVRAPNGRFFLESGSTPVVLVAGGIGITPMLSMLNDCLKQQNDREIWLFYGVRNGGEHVMKVHLENLAEQHPNFRLHVCYSRPLPDDVLGRDYQHQGHVDMNRLRLTLLLKPYSFYICGPKAMLESLVPALGAWGVPEHNVHYEAFGPASIAKTPLSVHGPSGKPPAVRPAALTVTFSQSEKSLTWDEGLNNLLELAESNGVKIDHGCRVGHCGACQTTVQEGEVEYIRAPEFTPDSGCCLPCSSRPKSNLTLLA
ncbi:MAG: 2Fe-2S iron-sulfur cluster-binding protein [Magnetococcus sp. XQGC-1]